MFGKTEELSYALFKISLILLVFLAGYQTHLRRVWPHHILEEGYAGMLDLVANAKAYAGILPTLHLYPSPREGAGVTVHEPGRTAEGHIFMAGLFDGHNAMRLVTSKGDLVHEWKVSFSETFPDLSHILPAEKRPTNDWLTHIHGAQPLPDGSVVFNFEEYGLVRLGKCGNVMWKLPRMTHHAISLGNDGTLWVLSRVYHTEPVERLTLHMAPFYEYQLLNVSLDGEVLKEISLPEVLIKNDLLGLMVPSTTLEARIAFDDYMHANDAEVLTPEVAQSFPQFEAGDIAVSLRQPNLIFVFDPETEKIKWFQVGPWWRQHDPDFLPNGKISVFDNRTDDTLRGKFSKGSRISQIDPATREMSIAYQQVRTKDSLEFYTYIMGKHQYLPNGNILMSQPTYGRALEVASDGTLVWEYINRYSPEQVALLTEATRYPKSYFNVSDWSCKQEGLTQ